MLIKLSQQLTDQCDQVKRVSQAWSVRSSDSRKMSYLNWLIPYLFVWLFIFRTAFSFLSVQEYFAARDKLQIKESMRSLGASLFLTGREQLVNNMLMVAKKREFQQSSDNLKFAPAIHFFNAKPLMLESQIFQFIRQMPKGIFTAN